MKNILITGATGQIGSELTMVLRKRYENGTVVAAGHTQAPDWGLLYPVVPTGVEEIRRQIAADHTSHDIDYVLDVLRRFKAAGQGRI